jgi:hypothetical protein
MSSEYQQGKDIGAITAKLNALAHTRDHHDCGCKGKKGQRPTSELSSENLRVLRLLRENSQPIRDALERALADLDIKPQREGTFLLSGFSIADPQDAADIPMTPFGPLIAACCSNGKYGVCFQIGCDPCADS